MGYFTGRQTEQELNIARRNLREMRIWDPIFDKMDGKRARFVRLVDDNFVELADNDGRILPDYRHITQVRDIAGMSKA